MSYYDPKEAIEDLLSKGIGKITITAANLNKGIYVAEMCSNIRELSRIFYELKDQKMIDTVSNLVYRVLVSFKTSRDFRLGNLEQMLCAMGYAALYKGFGASVTDIFSYLETIAESAIEKSPERALRIAMLIGYLGAAGLDFRMLDATNSALRKIIKFEEKFSARHGCLPELNHITLLVRNYPVTSRTWSRDAPYLNRENIYWLFRLSAEKIDTERKLVTDKAIEEFHSMYLTNFLPKGY